MRFLCVEIYDSHGRKLGDSVLINIDHIVTMRKTIVNPSVRIETIDGKHFHTNEEGFDTIYSAMKSEDTYE